MHSLESRCSVYEIITVFSDIRLQRLRSLHYLALASTVLALASTPVFVCVVGVEPLAPGTKLSGGCTFGLPVCNRGERQSSPLLCFGLMPTYRVISSPHTSLRRVELQFTWPICCSSLPSRWSSCEPLLPRFFFFLTAPLPGCFDCCLAFMCGGELGGTTNPAFAVATAGGDGNCHVERMAFSLSPADRSNEWLRSQRSQ